MEQLAQEVMEKICQLFQECSAVLRLEASQSEMEKEDLRARLDAMETELRTLLEGSGGREGTSENGHRDDEAKISHRTQTGEGCWFRRSTAPVLATAFQEGRPQVVTS